MEKRLWDLFQSWEEAEAAWDAVSRQEALDHPLKTTFSPSVPTIAPNETALRRKGLLWALRKDRRLQLVFRLMRHPFRYAVQFVRSFVKKTPYCQDGSLFFYGIKGLDEMKELMRKDDVILVVGFSYCQKPYECPCTRFSGECIHSLNNHVCRQCPIGKAMHALPHKRTILVIIPTINAIGKTILETIDAHPDKRVLFIITACEMALRMFADMGNMVGVRGVGIRLGGRVCNTFRAFKLSEEGIKPGVTVVEPSTQSVLFDLLRVWREKTARP